MGQGGDILSAPRGIHHRFIVESTEGVLALVAIRSKDFVSPIAKATLPLPRTFTEPLPKPSEEDMALLANVAVRTGLLDYRQGQPD